MGQELLFFIPYLGWTFVSDNVFIGFEQQYLVNSLINGSVSILYILIMNQKNKNETQKRTKNFNYIIGIQLIHKYIPIFYL